MSTKTLIVFPKFTAGGAEKASLAYVQSLNEIGSALLCTGSYHSAKGKPAKTTGDGGSLVRFVLRLSFNILRNNYDTVISFKAHAAVVPVCFLARFLKKNKFLLIMRESNDVMGYSQYEIKKRTGKFFFKFILKAFPALLCDRVVCNSERSKKNFISLTATDPKKVFCIYNPQCLQVESNATFAERKYDLIFQGRLEPQKNIFDFIEATTIVQSSRKLRSIIVGNGSLEYEVKSKLSDNKNSYAFDIARFDNTTKTSYLADSKCLLITSFYEGMPNIVFEAINNGCSVISYERCCGCSEILPDRFLVPSNSPQGMAEAVNAFFDGEIQPLDIKEIEMMAEKFSTTEFHRRFADMVN